MFRKPEGLEWLAVIYVVIRTIFFICIGLLLYYAWNNRHELLQSLGEVISDKDTVVNPMNPHCPEESYLVKQMYYYDHQTKSKTKLLVGGEEAVKIALSQIKGEKPMVYICHYPVNSNP